MELDSSDLGSLEAVPQSLTHSPNTLRELLEKWVGGKVSRWVQASRARQLIQLGYKLEKGLILILFYR